MDTTLREWAIIANSRYPQFLRAGVKLLGLVMLAKGHAETAANLDTLAGLSVPELHDYLSEQHVPKSAEPASDAEPAAA